MKLDFFLTTAHPTRSLRRGSSIRSGLDWFEYFSGDAESEAFYLLDSKVCIRIRKIKDKPQRAVYYLDADCEEWKPLLIFTKEERRK